MLRKMLQKLIARLPASWVRILFNQWRPFWGAGITVDWISPDYSTIKASLTLHWYNQNYVGVHFGGSIFVLTDAFYMIILMRQLGENYIVWDKAAYIEFKKPGRGKIRAVFSFTPEEVALIRAAADSQDKYIFERPVDVLNEQGEVVASVVKTLYVRRKVPMTLFS